MAQSYHSRNNITQHPKRHTLRRTGVADMEDEINKTDKIKNKILKMTNHHII